VASGGDLTPQIAGLFSSGATKQQVNRAWITDIVPTAGQGGEVYKLLRTGKQYHYFTAAEGAQYHCGPMAPQTRNQAVFDWLGQTL
jgi:hypothetical protein